MCLKPLMATNMMLYHCIHSHNTGLYVMTKKEILGIVHAQSQGILVLISLLQNGIWIRPDLNCSKRSEVQTVMCLRHLNQNEILKVTMQATLYIHLMDQLWSQLSITCWTTRSCQLFSPRMCVHHRTQRHCQSISYHLRTFALYALEKYLFLIQCWLHGKPTL